jgi:hypothetical protein
MSRDKAEALDFWYSDEMEQCPLCMEYAPWDELEALISTPPICIACRKRIQEERLVEMMAWPLGLA